jgi:uncharacterized lipoprotein YddW (UPF0748 family)
MLFPPKGYSINKEIRGIWYNPTASNVNVPNNYTLAKIKLYTDFSFYAEQNITEIFIKVKHWNQTLYNSSVLPNCYSFDLLTLACEIANSLNLSIHAWMPMQTSTPEYQQVAIDGTRCDIYNFVLPDVQNQIFSIINELVNYPIKGIHLDYIRYAGTNYGYDDYSVSKFMNETGINPRENPNSPEWIEWRKGQVTNIVNQTRIIVKSHDLNLKLSIASFPYPEGKLQDWFNWLKNGLIDFACPMNYETNSNVFESNIKYMLSQGINKNRILMGIGIWQIDNETFHEQVNITRDYGFAGFVLFRDAYLNDKTIPPLPSASNSNPLWFENPFIFAMLIIAIAVCIYIFVKW